MKQQHDNPIMSRKRAVAITYDKVKQAAPVVSAKGRGMIAENIIQEAVKHQIPIQEDPALVELLLELELNETIPEELYEVIAEVLSFVYQLHQQEKENLKPLEEEV
ncbi:EscU/YscU/HrcU family type III secretion system export apparatus switch protein [Sutcliffiella halmapala]|uniref:EscU/YscU/HrcU family type III secretion system export apparatus switch protein n=1 Tax=Sutcliffiella halmapala TaxID=79882 RepID=UPI000995C261|nr:EscU/YscU/HrcU family type III secretion system export apparatus switch protein [Sutcliffiella halmapala]